MGSGTSPGVSMVPYGENPPEEVRPPTEKLLDQIAQLKTKEYRDPALKTVAEAFLELFKLLEEHAPSWYTDEHRNRAIAAMRVLRDLDTLLR